MHFAARVHIVIRTVPRRCDDRFSLPAELEQGSSTMAQVPAWYEATYTRIRGQWAPSRPAAGAVPKQAPVLRRKPAAAGNLADPEVALNVVREDLVTPSGFEPQRWTKIIDGRPCLVATSMQIVNGRSLFYFHNHERSNSGTQLHAFISCTSSTCRSNREVTPAADTFLRCTTLSFEHRASRRCSDSVFFSRVCHIDALQHPWLVV